MFRNFSKMAVDSLPALGATGLFALSAYAASEQTNKRIEEFKNQYPGEEPVIKIERMGRYSYVTVQRAEPCDRNPSTSAPTLK
jgi:hypothetical protein